MFFKNVKDITFFMLFFFSLRGIVFPWGRTVCQDVTVNVKSSLNIIQIDLYCIQNNHCSSSQSIKHNNSKYLKITTHNRKKNI